MPSNLEITDPNEDPLWLPARIYLNTVMPWVTWAQCRDVQFSEPFFYQTIDRLEERSPEMSVRKKLCSLIANKATSDSIAGFIFHVSRCGSTLVSNALKKASDSVVLAEPQPVGAILTPYESGLWACSRPAFANFQDALLRSLVYRYASYAVEQEKKLVIKFVSWNTLFIETILHLWPNIPSIILIRHPLEVAVSNIHQPSRWLNLRKRPTEASGLFSCCSNSNDLSREAFVASVLAKLYTVIASVRSACVRILDFSTLTTSLVMEIASFFGLRLHADNLREVFANYSKDASGFTKFYDDSFHKRQAASELLRMEIDARSIASYNNCLSRCGAN